MYQKTIKILAAIMVSLISTTSMADYPVGVQDNYSTLNGRVLDVLSNDSGDNLRVVAVNDWTVKGGRAAITPGPAYQVGRYLTYTGPSGFIGEDSFWYVLEDTQGRRNAARVVVNVAPPTADNLPVLKDDVVDVQKDNTIRIEPLENDVNAPEFVGGTYRVSSLGKTMSGGQVKLVVGRGGLSYTPPRGFTGVDKFTYTVTFQTGRFSFVEKQATIRVNVTDAYTAGPYPYTKPDNVKARSNIANGTIAIYPLDNDIGQGLRISSESNQPEYVNGYSARGNFWFTSGGNFKQILYNPRSLNGEDKIYYIIEDALGRKNWGVITINIE